MPAVVITEFMDDAAVEALRAVHDTLYDPDLWEDRPRLESLLPEVRALVVRNKTSVDADLVSAAQHLEVVGRLGVGLDNIDLAACEAAHIAVRPATGANANAVAEYVVGAALALTRGVLGASDAVAAGSWPRTEMVGSEIMGKVLGLVGFGGIARLVATKARALGMSIAAFDPFLAVDDPSWEGTTRCEELSGLLEMADVVSLHVPLTDDTAGLFDAGVIGGMKQGAVLVNTSRGGIVDEDAVAAALRTGHLGGAALDVFTTEPLDAGAGRALVDVPNLILTPHIAGVTIESNVAVSATIAAFVLDALA